MSFDSRLQAEVDRLAESRNALKAEKDNLERVYRESAAVQTSVARPGAVEDGARGLIRYLESLTYFEFRGLQRVMERGSPEQVKEILGQHWAKLQDAARAVLEGVKGGYL
jgi:hypothetical protein